MLSQNQHKFFIEKTTEKDSLSLRITKVSRKEIQTTDSKVHNFQITKISKKGKQKMNVVDFISVLGQQQFEKNTKINPIRIKIENEKAQIMFLKYSKYIIRLKLESLILSSSIKNDTEKIFLVTNGLSDAKYSLINDELFKTIGVINLREIENWEKIKKVFLEGKCKFPVETESRSAKHFSYNFSMRKTVDVLNLTLTLIDHKNKFIKFEKNKKNCSVGFFN